MSARLLGARLVSLRPLLLRPWLPRRRLLAKYVHPSSRSSLILFCLNSAAKCPGNDCGPHGLCIAGKCECAQPYTGQQCEILPDNAAPPESDLSIMTFREKQSRSQSPPPAQADSQLVKREACAIDCGPHGLCHQQQVRTESLLCCKLCFAVAVLLSVSIHRPRLLTVN